MKSKEKLALIKATEAILGEVEAKAIERINIGLQASFDNMARQLERKYPDYATSKMPNLLPQQRAALLMEQILPVAGLIDPQAAKGMNKTFRDAIKSAHDQGSQMGKDLLALHMKPSDIQESTAKLPIDAIAAAAQDATGRLSRHGLDFREKATGLIIQGLAQGWGVQRVKGQLVNQLGATKTSADMIARTETLAATNQAAIKQYQAQGVRYFQVMATAADRRTCPFCVGRNMAVYQIGKVSQPPFHPRCRCYAMPWEPSWMDSGLIDAKEIQTYYQEGIENLKAVGKVPTFALTPFEKLQGLKEAPKAVWTPKGAIGLPTNQPLEGSNPNAVSINGKLYFLQEITEETLESLYYSGLYRGSYVEDEDLPYTLAGEGVPQSYRTNVANIARDVGLLLGGNYPPSLKSLVYDGSKTTVGRAEGFLKVGELGRQREAIYKGIGSHLEYSYPEILKLSNDFLRKRAKANGEDFKALKDTQVLAFGLRDFSSPEAMKALLKSDPELFMFTLKTIEGIRDGRFRTAQEIADQKAARAKPTRVAPMVTIGKYTIPKKAKLEDMQTIFDDLHSGDPKLKQKAAILKTKFKDQPVSNEAIVEIMEALNKVFQGKLPPSFKKLQGSGALRAYASKAGEIDVGGYANAESIYHEMGHHLEFSYPEALQIATDFVFKRASGSPKRLNELTSGDYDDSEVAYPDAFVDPYVGKIYNDGSTEVISMGLERFTDAKSMRRFYNKDPDHFRLTLEILQAVRENRYTVAPEYQ